MNRIAANDALIVVDVQNDFCPGGTLAVADGDGVVPIANRLMPLFEHVVVTRDWHPPNHCSFADEPEFVDGSWPAHCVQDTSGAAFHPGLAAQEAALVISKATDPSRDAYSSFDETDLEKHLRARGIERVYVCGLATDYCVKATALDAHRAGFDTIVVVDACRAVDNPPGNGQAALNELETAGVRLAQSEELLNA